MWTKGLRLWRFTLCILFAVSAFAAVARADEDVPSESQCRPYIEKALKELESGDVEPDYEKNDSSEISIDDGDDTKEAASAESGVETADAGDSEEDGAPSVEIADEPYIPQGSVEEVEGESDDTGSKEDLKEEDINGDSNEQQADESKDEGDSKEETASAEDETNEEENTASKDDSKEESDDASINDSKENEASQENEQNSAVDDNESGEIADESGENKDDDDKTKEDEGSQEKADDSDEETSDKQDDESNEKTESDSDEKTASAEEKAESTEERTESVEDKAESAEDKAVSEEEKDESGEEEDTIKQADDSEEDKQESGEETAETSDEKGDTQEDKESVEEKDVSVEEKEDSDEKAEMSNETAEGELDDKSQEEEALEEEEVGVEETDKEEEGAPEEDLLLTVEIPENLRSRDHISKILRLDEEASEAELIVEKSAEIILRDLKRLYENSIKPLEGVYKYRDLSNRHFGDPEIFSKPLILFMGPWSGGKSSILNYLTGLEFTEWSLRTGAEPSPAYFNILMHGKDPEVLDGTQLAADWTFSGLQKFGQGLEERLRGLRYPSKILEKVNIVEIPGILEVRKQVSRVFPFNDACQWFIDRADIIFLVYDPSKLDVGPETEAILDQLKGRESQTRILLNKADTVKPEELMRVQSALIWNISPLMSSAQPPVMYTVSLWSMPFEAGAPTRLLQAQERELLRDLRQAIDKRIENKISSARRFAVRVRNHAKMVDCYLTTYYNHKTIFGNRKLIADAIIENPQNYHIYEGLSTLTNISRYDLPDPETYRDFFRLNPLYEFSQLSATCTYFRGCPITRLDVAIAYDLPELVGKYKKMVETATPQGMPKS